MFQYTKIFFVLYYPQQMILPRSWLVLLLGAAGVYLMMMTAGKEHQMHDFSCPCPLLQRPPWEEKERYARWMVHTLDWGVLSTISSKFNKTNGVPFGNVYSFVDGACDNSTGVPYFWGTFMDQSFQDISLNAHVSLTLSQAALSSVCGPNEQKANPVADCSIATAGDPESPVCARLVIMGTIEIVAPPAFAAASNSNTDVDEYNTVRSALFHRHPQMADWPVDHDWILAKLTIQHLWFIDFFGGATVLDINKYFSQRLAPVGDMQ